MRYMLMTLLAASLLAGCTSSKPQGMISKIKGAKMTEPQLDARLAEYQTAFMIGVESTAGRIALESTDPAHYQAALLWMIRTSEEVIRAASHPDPVAILLDSWALASQMRQFFESGDGAEAFGSYQQRVIDTMAQIEEAAVTIADDMVGPDAHADIDEMIREWVVANPISRARLSRSSTAPLLAEYGRRKGGGVMGAVGDLDQNVSRISDRLDIMTTQLPKQIIWNAALLVHGSVHNLQVGSAMERVDRALELAESLGGEMDRQRTDTIDRISTERREALDQIDSLREGASRDIDLQRTDTIDRIESTLEASLGSFDAQRADSFDRLDATINGSIEQIDVQRAETLAEMDAMIAESIGSFDRMRSESFDELERMRATSFRDADDTAAAIVDRIFYRAVVLVLVAGLTGAGLLLLARLLRR
jgi:hypothetical protein